MKTNKEKIFEFLEENNYSIDYGLNSWTINGFSFTYEGDEEDHKETDSKLIELLNSLNEKESINFRNDYFNMI